MMILLVEQLQIHVSIATLNFIISFIACKKNTLYTHQARSWVEDRVKRRMAEYSNSCKQVG